MVKTFIFVQISGQRTCKNNLSIKIIATINAYIVIILSVISLNLIWVPIEYQSIGTKEKRSIEREIVRK